MGKLYLLKQKLISLGIMLMVVLVAAGFSLVLGRYFLNNIVKSYPVGKTVYKKVYYQVQMKKIRLNPIPIYTLQAGVFLDIAGAQEFANSLLGKGLRPFITPVSPHKVLIFAASTREDLEKYRAKSPEDVFVVTEILNAQEVEFSVQRKEWVEFLTGFTNLFSDTLVVLDKSDSAKEKALAEAWLELAVFLQKQAGQETTKDTGYRIQGSGDSEDRNTGNTSRHMRIQIINALIVDCKAMASMLNSPNITIQEHGSNAKVILKAKYDFDTFRQILMQF